MVSDLAVAFESFLSLLGAFIVFSLARIAYQGVRETRSATLLRLAVAFSLLGMGNLVSSLSGLAQQGVLPGLALLVSFLFLINLVALTLEVAGYFFLAFSHAIDVLSLSRMGLLPALLIVTNLDFAATLKSVAVVLLLYAVVETTLSYRRTKNRGTLVIAGGFALLASGELATWVSLLYVAPPLLVITSLLVKILGFATLYTPVIKFSPRRSP